MVMIQALIGPATKLLGKFIEDKDQKNKLAHDLATLASRHAQELAKGQIAANKRIAELSFENARIKQAKQNRKKLGS